MQTESGVLLSDDVLFTFERSLDGVGGMPKEPNKRYADERAREERKLRDRFNELGLLEDCTEP